MMHCICPICLETFIPKNKMQRYCSMKCSVENNRRKTKARWDASDEYKRRRNNRRKAAMGVTPCECCGIRPVAPGFRKLCDLCFAWDGMDWVNNEQGTRVIV